MKIGQVSPAKEVRIGESRPGPSGGIGRNKSELVKTWLHVLGTPKLQGKKP